MQGFFQERVTRRRWIPPWLRHEHVTRYQWACQFTDGAVVLDTACGVGYGAAILAEQGNPKRIDGFDTSPEAIAEAQRALAGKSIVRFTVGDVTCLPAPDQEYDVYLCFETIEHVRDDTAVLKEAVRVLRPGGTFVCSTPNRCAVNPGLSIEDQPMNPFHVREYTQNELHAVLSPYFSDIDWYGQTICPAAYCRLMNRIGRRFPALAVRVNQARRMLLAPIRNARFHSPRKVSAAQEPEVLIAICRYPMTRFP